MKVCWCFRQDNAATLDQMKTEYTVVVNKADDWWVGWIEELSGVNCQEKTYDELMETLRVTLQEALGFN